MKPKISDEELYRKAREIVEAKKGFYIHLIIYLIFCGVMYLIWRLTWTGYRWYIWPVFGWGIGVLFHFLGVFAFGRPMGWEESQVEKEVERLRERHKS